MWSNGLLPSVHFSGRAIPLRSRGRLCDRRFVRASVVLDVTHKNANGNLIDIYNHTIVKGLKRISLYGHIVNEHIFELWKWSYLKLLPRIQWIIAHTNKMVGLKKSVTCIFFRIYFCGCLNRFLPIVWISYVLHVWIITTNGSVAFIHTNMFAWTPHPFKSIEWTLLIGINELYFLPDEFSR